MRRLGEGARQPGAAGGGRTARVGGRRACRWACWLGVRVRVRGGAPSPGTLLRSVWKTRTSTCSEGGWVGGTGGEEGHTPAAGPCCSLYKALRSDCKAVLVLHGHGPHSHTPSLRPCAPRTPGSAARVRLSAGLPSTSAVPPSEPPITPKAWERVGVAAAAESAAEGWGGSSRGVSGRGAVCDQLWVASTDGPQEQVASPRGRTQRRAAVYGLNPSICAPSSRRRASARAGGGAAAARGEGSPPQRRS